VNPISGRGLSATKISGLTMGKSRYADFAADCVRLAGQTTDPMSKLRLLGMAAVWLRLADEAEKNSQTDRVSETQLHAD